MKKIIGIFLAVLAVLLFVRVFLGPKIVESRFDKQISEMVGIDRSADLEDGLHVYVCGAGAPLPDPKRSGPCLGVLAGDQAFIFDTGTGGARNLSLMGFPVGRVNHVFFTHLHSDHIDGFGEVSLGAWINGGRSTPLPVVGPVGTQRVIEGFNEVYAIDRGYRIAHHTAEIANPSGANAKAIEIELENAPRVVFENAGVTITAFPVSHEPVSPSFGYRVDYKDRSISISGDTIYDPNIAIVSKNVDVLFHEALNMEMVKQMEAAAKKNGSDQMAKIFFDIRDYHTSPVDAAKIAHAAEAESLVLYHIVPMLPHDALIPLFIKGVEAEYSGKVTVSEDGTIIRLPTNSDAILYENGL